MSTTYSLLDIRREGQIATIELKRLERAFREAAADGNPGGVQRAAFAFCTWPTADTPASADIIRCWR